MAFFCVLSYSMRVFHQVKSQQAPLSWPPSHKFLPQHSESSQAASQSEELYDALQAATGHLRSADLVCLHPKWRKLQAFRPLMSVFLCAVEHLVLLWKQWAGTPQWLSSPSSHTPQRTCWRWRGWIWKSQSQSQPATSSAPPGWETPRLMLFWTKVREPSVKRVHLVGGESPSGTRHICVHWRSRVVNTMKRRVLSRDVTTTAMIGASRLSVDSSQNDFKVQSVKSGPIYDSYISKSSTHCPQID